MFDFNPGPLEAIVIGVLAVLLFGDRLPEVARSVGKGLMSLKRSMQGIQSEITAATSDVQSTVARATQIDEIDDYEEATAPKFEPPATKPPAAPKPPTA